MKKWIALSLSLVLAFSAIGGALASGILSFGTGSVGGTDNVVLEALSSVANSKTDLRTSTVTTSGGAEIIYLIESGDVQGGYSGTIDLVNAMNGAAPFEAPIAVENMLQGFGFVTWALPIVVLENSDIQTYEDLEGKHVGFPPAASSSTAAVNLVFEAYGLMDKCTIDYFFLKKMKWQERVLAGLSAVCFLWPVYVADIIGIVLFAVLMVWHITDYRKNRPNQPVVQEA